MATPGAVCGCLEKRSLVRATAGGTRERVCYCRAVEAYGVPVGEGVDSLEEIAACAAPLVLPRLLDVKMMGKSLVKSLSECGGVPARPNTPGWACTPLIRDAGNKQYAMALRAMLQADVTEGFDSLAFLNVTTIGNLFKAALALSAGPGPDVLPDGVWLVDSLFTPKTDEAAVQLLLVVAAAEDRAFRGGNYLLPPAVPRAFSRQRNYCRQCSKIFEGALQLATHGVETHGINDEPAAVVAFLMSV